MTIEKRIYNYRLCRARRVVENAFGILATRFRIFHTSINLREENIDAVMLACCVLHNFLRSKCTDTYTPSEILDYEDLEDGIFTPGARTDSSNLLDLQKGICSNPSNEVKNVRNTFVEYFNYIHALPWQKNFV